MHVLVIFCVINKRKIIGMKLLVTADDFGYCPKRNEAIFKLLESGKISRTSLMVNVPVYSEEAAKMIRNGFENRIGLHFNITEGKY